MPAGPSRSPRKSGSLATQRTQSRRFFSATPIRGTRSRRISKRAAEVDDALARENARLAVQQLESYGLRKGEKTPASLGALLRQRDCAPNDPFGGVFDDDDFGGFDTSMGMDYGNGDEWYSEEELEDDTEDELPSTETRTEDAIRTEKEVNNWTKFIGIVTGDTVTQEGSSFCTCNKSTRSIPIVSLSTGVLNWS